LTDPEWIQEVLLEHLARVHWVHHRSLGLGHLSSSVVIDHLDVFGSGGGPLEADPELVIDSDAVLPGPITLELLEPVARRDGKVTDPLGGVEIRQLPPGD